MHGSGGFRLVVVRGGNRTVEITFLLACHSPFSTFPTGRKPCATLGTYSSRPSWFSRSERARTCPRTSQPTASNPLDLRSMEGMCSAPALRSIRPEAHRPPPRLAKRRPVTLLRAAVTYSVLVPSRALTRSRAPCGPGPPPAEPCHQHPRERFQFVVWLRFCRRWVTAIDRFGQFSRFLF
jgi:hypothetical protein